MTDILVSADEHSEEVFHWLNKLGVPYKVSSHSFDLGDYIVGGYEDEETVYGNIVVERATVNDYWEKLKARRMNNQLVDLSFNFRLSVLAIIGSIETGLSDEAQVDYQTAIHSMLAGIVSAGWKKCNQDVTEEYEEGGNIVVINFVTEYAFVVFLKELLERSTKEDPRIPRMERLSRRPEWQMQFFLQSIPGIGEGLCKSLMFHFPCPFYLVTATVEDLMMIEGIGKIKAKSIYDFFRTPINPVF